MIDIPIIDTHLHLWDLQRLHYPWLAGAPAINRSHLPADYQAATAGTRVAQMVFVQCEAEFAQYEQEVAWVTEQAAIDPRITGIVAWAPLEQGEAARADLAALSKYPLMRGIRRIIQFEADDRFCLRPHFIRGVQLLPEYNLSFDLCIKGDVQFRHTLELVRQCPKVKFILDHIAKPSIKERIHAPWAGYIRELAALPNTWCKVSGLVTEADHAHWTPADLRPYLDTVLASFASDRVIFGGDWPVVTLASPWQRWVDTLWDATASLTPDARRKLFHDNAKRFYRLPETAPCR